ncbi:MAG TPA: hypothetical protein VHZ03_23765, partial [Trebonia sp.]|nr:hypothetical protein [Trebonia sp.]
PVAGDELEVTSQRRMDQLRVAEIVEAIHGVLSSPVVSGKRSALGTLSLDPPGNGPEFDGI